MKGRLPKLIPWLFILWAAFVYAYHYLSYYGPRATNFLSALLSR